MGAASGRGHGARRKLSQAGRCPRQEICSPADQAHQVHQPRGNGSRPAGALAMITKFIEATNGPARTPGNWGKFLLARFDREWFVSSQVETHPVLGASLLRT